MFESLHNYLRVFKLPTASIIILVFSGTLNSQNKISHNSDAGLTAIGPFGGCVSALCFHPQDKNIMYAGIHMHEFSDYLYKTTDGGKTWINTNFIDYLTG